MLRDFIQRRLRLTIVAGGLWTLAGCGGAEPGVQVGEPDAAVQEDVSTKDTVMPSSSVIAAQEELTPTLMELPGVVGTAVGLCDEQPCIKVYLARRDQKLEAQIPDSFQGFKVDTEVTGEFEARDTSP